MAGAVTPGGHILLVEDNPADVELTKFALEDAGIDATMSVVEDGTDALDYLYRRPPFEKVPTPALVLLDIRLPRLDGTEVLRRIRSDASLRSLIVVVLTADDDLFDAMGGQADQCDGYLRKPVDPGELRELAERLLA
jgi:two-component system response regulator